MQIMTLCHDVIMSSIVSMPHSYFRMKLMSYGCWQLYIKLLQYIFTSMHQINIHQNTPNLTYVIKLWFCRPYGRFQNSLPQVVVEPEQPVKDSTTGI